MNLSTISWKIGFELSRLWMPVEPRVYDSRFNPGDVTDYYERYIVTREIRGYRLWYISFFVSNPLIIRKLDLFSDKLLAVKVAKAATNDKYFIGKQVKHHFSIEIGSFLLKLSLTYGLMFLSTFAVESLLTHYRVFTLSSKPITVHWSKIMLSLMGNCSTEKPSYKWNPPLPLNGTNASFKNSCDRDLK